MVLIFHLIEDYYGLTNVVSRCFTWRSCFELSEAWNIRGHDCQARGRILKGAQHLLSGLSLVVNESPSSLRCCSVVLADSCKIVFSWSPVLVWRSHWLLFFREKLVVSQYCLIIQMSLSLLIEVASVSIWSVHRYRTNWFHYLCWFLLLYWSLLPAACCGILVNRRDASDPSQVRLTLIVALSITIVWSDLTFLRLDKVIVAGICGGSNVNLWLNRSL